ncbi:MAG TPA: VanZ family protein [Stellaceae bacterium]|nr:VanZ family protein [Stellaceae bacterium]
MLNRNYLLGALVVLAGIAYLSLYPFRWRIGLPAGGPVDALLLTWRRWPKSRGDVIANVLLYLPWGFFVARSVTRAMPSWLRLLVATVVGTLLSVAMELSQFYVAERYTDMYDVYTNTLGACLGALGGLMLASDSRANLPRASNFQMFPALLLGAFVFVRLYPFVPVIDLHKYLAALRPLLAVATLAKGDMFLRTVTWLVVCYLVETLFGRRSALPMFVLVAGGIFLGRILIVDARVSLPSVLSAGLALLLWFAALRFMPGRVAVLAIAFASVVMLQRLAPFQLSATGRGFDWVPFLDLLRAPIETGFLVMIDKFFLYGGLIWLLMSAGLRLWRATVATALLLLFCSLIEMYLPGRSAGITDALLALLIGTLLRLTAKPRQVAAQPA